MLLCLNTTPYSLWFHYVYTTITLPYSEICVLIWPTPYRLEATHDPSFSLLSEFFFLSTLSPTTSWCFFPTNYPGFSDLGHE
jgi:hypothetical protein